LVNYSVKVQPKQKVLIHGELGSEPLISACFKKCLQAGRIHSPYRNCRWVESTLRYGSPSIRRGLPPLQGNVRNHDARIRILGELNTKSFPSSTGQSLAIFWRQRRRLKIVLEREANGEMKWVAALFPPGLRPGRQYELAEYEISSTTPACRSWMTRWVIGKMSKSARIKPLPG
jgi:hypothetical protein